MLNYPFKPETYFAYLFSVEVPTANNIKQYN